MRRRFARLPRGRSSKVAVSVTALVLLTTTAAAAAPAIGPRPQAGPAGLPDGRAFEQVSPVDKNGNPVTGALKTSSDGNGIAFRASGAFAGAESSLSSVYYRSERTSDGWQTTSENPPIHGRAPEQTDEPAWVGASEDLSRTFLAGRYPYDAGDQGTGSGAQGFIDVYRGEPDGTWSWQSKGPTSPDTQPGDVLFRAASPDGSRAVVQTTRRLTDDVPAGAGQQVYQQVDGEQHLMSVAPNGEPLPGGAALGGAGSLVGTNPTNSIVGGPFPTAVSPDGETVVFSSEATGQIYVRTNALRNDAETTEVTASQAAATAGQSCSFTQYLTTAADGSKVLFWCIDQLTDDSAGVQVYSYDVVDRTLSALPGTENTFLPEFVAADPDLNYVYLQASEVLAPGGVDFDRNLYVAHDGGIRYLGSLTLNSPVALSGDGSVALFPTTGPLDPTFDNAGMQEMYAFDANTGTDGTVTCVSCRTDGQPAAGTAGFGTSDAGTFGATDFGEFGTFDIRRPDDSITADGSRMFFTSTDRVVPGATNGQANVYEYQDGRVSLLSSGTAPSPSIFAGVSKDGANAFLITHEALVPQDNDGTEADLYAARIGGGFTTPSPPERCSSGDDCRESSTGGASVPVPGSTGAVGSGNVQPAKSTASVRPTVTLSSVSTRVRAALAAGRTATLTARVTGRGTVTLRARARVGGATITVGSARRPLGTQSQEAATVHLHLRLSSAARRQLRTGARLRVTIEARITGSSSVAKRTVTVRQTSTKKTSR
jgi:hypothetical protein